MDCKKCIWFKIHEYKFPDGTKTITCEKYNKHLGFTNKRGQVNKIKDIGCNKVKDEFSKCEVEPIINQNGVFYNMKTTKYDVKVNDHDRYSVIATVDSVKEAKEILELFKVKKSYIPYIFWEKKSKRWLCKVWDSKKKKGIYVAQSKYFAEAIKKLDEYKKENEIYVG